MKANSLDRTASANALSGVSLALSLVSCCQVLCRNSMVKLHLQTHWSPRRSSQLSIFTAMNCSVVLRSQPLLLVMQSVSSCTPYVVNLWPFQPATKTWMSFEGFLSLSLTSGWEIRLTWAPRLIKACWFVQPPGMAITMRLVFSTIVAQHDCAYVYWGCLFPNSLDFFSQHSAIEWPSLSQ